mmetsp:Transcript_21061/g.27141  ORF Transcript_21061/g.27141 Transcript_21061/m.27141 type:complete len:311 (-) Transcript_21061:233-1165(-)|eukprot:CAMPEP_0116061268 /NCGR_PEP_ID=MMETSP0322-20121206/6978_1 /TAXON_ID=163516 /ORGANISM="Leptocylindrus danicus var. apora, Strain B651" /LENGTH=310 /DNA_ID=CAMNT_0003546183 /DNA_START=655 /DNA_END=1587 /DNA_ORIENTATION=+
MNELERSNWIKQEVSRPTKHDVLFGRGGGVNRHAGNVNFRKLVGQYEFDYRTTSRKHEKTEISAMIVSIVRSMDPPGRFLKNSGGIWRDVGDEKARNKTSQALRERGPSVFARRSEAEAAAVKSTSSLNINTLISTRREKPTALNPSEKAVPSNQEGVYKDKSGANLRVKCKMDPSSNTWACISQAQARSIIAQRAQRLSVEDANLVASAVQDPYVANPTKTKRAKILDHDMGGNLSPKDVAGVVFNEGGLKNLKGFPDYPDSTVLIRTVTDSLSLVSSESVSGDLNETSGSAPEEADGVQALLQLARCC